MKAHVYVVEVCGCWKARVTINPEVDKQYWMNGEFGEAGSLNKETANEGWLLQEGLPLGDACYAAELWDAAIMRGKGKKAVIYKGLNEDRRRDGRLEAIELLIACTTEARAEGAGGGKAGIVGEVRRGQRSEGKVKGGAENVRKVKGMGRWWRWGSWKKRAGTVGGENLYGLVEPWERDLSRDGRVERVGETREGKETEWSEVRRERGEGVGETRGHRETERTEVRWERGEGVGETREHRETERTEVRWERGEGVGETRGHRETERSEVRRERGEGVGKMRGHRETERSEVKRELVERVSETRRHRETERSEVKRERGFSSGELGEIAAGAKLAADILEGRALLRSEAHALLAGAGCPGAAASWSGVLQLAALLGRVRLSGSVAAGYGGRLDAFGRRRQERRCKRCGSGEAHMHRTACAACGRNCAYCMACIGMGRSRECELLVTGQRRGLVWVEASAAGSARVVKPLSFEKRLVKWGLSPAQTAAAAKALQFVEEPSLERSLSKQKDKPDQVREFLLWAVTGAGKTEMIFPLVESVLLRGGRALIATPRRDVVIELDPRIRKAFPAASVVTLYGGSEQRWESGNITLATTHQLLRFYQGFDLVVIDELDAFPYAGDPQLHFAADKSCAPGAVRLLLSATPPSELQRAAKRGKLPHARVPVRYHRHPLPVPNLLQMPAVKQMLEQRKLPSKLLAVMRSSLNRNAQLFVFVQQISQTEPMAALLRAVLAHPAVSATSSQDAERTEKVQRFRSREIRVLVTTTILERGVTIPKSDVFILDADGRLFDEASLVQMAGRAGRSAEDPFGRVYFCSRDRNRAQIHAVQHIKTMNRMARKQGYLLPKTKGGSPK